MPTSSPYIAKKDALRPGLTVVIPAYNEEESLSVWFPELLDYCESRGWEVVVVNDGSTDGTRRILENHAGRKGCRIFHHKINRGYGGALKTGLSAARTEFAVTIDADGQHTLEDVERLHDTIVREDADLVVGGRHGQKSASRYRGVGKFVIRSVSAFLMPLPIHDINSGMKIYRTRLAQAHLPLCPDSMAFSDVMTLSFISQRHRVLEIPITVKPRRAGHSTITTRTAFDTLMEILNIVILFNPMRVFLPAAAFCIVMSVGWGIPIVLRGRGVSVGSMLAFLLGAFLFFLGLLAEQLSMLRKGSIARPAKELTRDHDKTASPAKPE